MRKFIVGSNCKMTTPSFITIFAFVFLLTLSVAACGQAVNKTSADNKLHVKHNLEFDTSKTAIIEFNKRSRWPFDSTYSAATLLQPELKTIDSFFVVVVENYNNSLDKEHKQWSIDINNRNYKKQLIVVTNNKGEKEVWVNCFCRAENDKWKTKMFGVEDGGNCYFNFKVNLTIKTYYDLGVNGVA
jgi:hypothetical protein